MKLPKIDKIPKLERFKGCYEPVLIQISKEVISNFRANSNFNETEALDAIEKEYKNFQDTIPKTLINATGVIIHTNLGRSIISDEILNRASKFITSYSNLEFSQALGKRGDRYAYISRLLSLLFGSEEAILVNNNAAAVFLILNTFAKNKEVIVSRGELVEIGGSFRIPEVMSNSGAILREVGTTNRSKISDYENAINSETAMLLKVHRSNFSVVGFSQEVQIDEISNLAKKMEKISYFDLGSGYANHLPYGLGSEPPVAEILQSGVDILSFSGDKLLGSVQCGIILGKKEFIQKIRQNQLFRMLRVDKITLAILSESIKAYLDKDYSLITTQNQLFLSLDELKNRALKVKNSIKFECDLLQTTTFLGGGTMPNKSFPSLALAFLPNLEPSFRQKGIVGRVENEKFLLDFRSILENEIPNLIKLINEI